MSADRGCASFVSAATSTSHSSCLAKSLLIDGLLPFLHAIMANKPITISVNVHDLYLLPSRWSDMKNGVRCSAVVAAYVSTAVHYRLIISFTHRSFLPAWPWRRRSRH